MSEATTPAATGVLRAPSLELEGLVHGFSCSLDSDADHAAFRRALGLDEVPTARLKQVHGDAVIDAFEAAAADPRREGDALIASGPGAVLTVATADCVPLLLADTTAGVVAAVHAGWRGMRARIVVRALEAMTARGAEASRLRAAIGPCVQGACYRVGDEVRAEFTARFPGAAELFDGDRLDLIRAACDELTRFGLSDDAVSVIERCTHCDESLASHRRQGPERGTNLSAIALL